MSTDMTVNGVSTGLQGVYFNVDAPRFFEIVGTPLLAGPRSVVERRLQRASSDGGERGVRPHVSHRSATARTACSLYPGAPREMEIVGVVKDAVYETLRAEPPPTIYMSYAAVARAAR